MCSIHADEIEEIVKMSTDTIMQLLPDIIRANFEAGFDLFCIRIFGSEQHTDCVGIFRDYFVDMESALEMDFRTLSMLTTVFVDEPDFVNEYNNACGKIVIALADREEVHNLQ